MVISEKLREKRREIKSNILLLYQGLGDPRVPLLVKVLSLLIVAYIINPIDLIPDFIPVLGLLDEVILVPIFLSFTMRLVPGEIRHEYEQEETGEIEDKRLSYLGSVMILIIWCVLIGLCLYYLESIKFWR